MAAIASSHPAPSPGRSSDRPSASCGTRPGHPTPCTAGDGSAPPWSGGVVLAIAGSSCSSRPAASSPVSIRHRPRQRRRRRRSRGLRRSAARPAAGAVYVVQPGDTFWSIAATLVPAGDVRAEVDRLAALNGSAALAGRPAHSAGRIARLVRWRPQ